MPGGGFFVFGGFTLHPVKKILWNYSRDTARCDDFPITVFTDIFSVVQDSRHKIQVDFLSPYRGNTFAVEMVADFFHGFTLIVHSENLQHDRGGAGVKLIVSILVNLITESRCPAVVFAL